MGIRRLISRTAPGVALRVTHPPVPVLAPAASTVRVPADPSPALSRGAEHLRRLLAPGRVPTALRIPPAGLRPRRPPARRGLTAVAGTGGRLRLISVAGAWLSAAGAGTRSGLICVARARLTCVAGPGGRFRLLSAAGAGGRSRLITAARARLITTAGAKERPRPITPTGTGGRFPLITPTGTGGRSPLTTPARTGTRTPPSTTVAPAGHRVRRARPPWADMARGYLALALTLLPRPFPTSLALRAPTTPAVSPGALSEAPSSVPRRRVRDRRGPEPDATP
jgi:hypothetical protein